MEILQSCIRILLCYFVTQRCTATPFPHKTSDPSSPCISPSKYLYDPGGKRRKRRDTSVALPEYQAKRDLFYIKQNGKNLAATAP